MSRQVIQPLDITEVVENVRNRSILSYVTETHYHYLLKKASTLKQYNAGTWINEEVDPGQLVILASGSIGIYNSVRQNEPLATVVPGRSLELDTLFKDSGEGWQWKWRAETRCVLLILDWSIFRKVLQSQPATYRYLETISTSSELHKFKNELSLVGLDTKAVIETFNLIKLSTAVDSNSLAGKLCIVRRGDVLFQLKLPAGKPAAAHYLVGDYFFVDPNTEGIVLEPHAGTELWTLDSTEWAATVSREHVDRFLRLVNFALVQREAYAKAKERRKVPTSDAARYDDEDEDEGLDVPDFKCTPQELAKIQKKKFAFVRQHDELDCGAACLSMVAKFYGKRISVAGFRALTHVTRDGTSLLSLKKASFQVGMEAIGIMSSPPGLKTLRTPFIALMQYHFIVVYKVTEEYVEVGDPGVGLLRYDMERFKKEFSQYCLLIRTTPKLQEYPNSQYSYQKYLGLFRGCNRDIFNVSLSAFLGFLLGLISPLLMQVGMDSIVMEGKGEYRKVFVLCLLAAYILQGITSWVQSYVVLHFSSIIDAKLTSAFIQHLFRLPLSYFSVRRVGDFITRLGELSKIEHFLTGQPLSLILNLVSIIVYSSVLAIYSVKILLLLLCSMPIMLGVILVVTPKLSKLLNESFQAMTRLSSIVFEHFNNLETLRSLNGYVAARWRFEKQVLDTIVPGLKHQKMDAWLGAFSGLFYAVLTTGVMLLAVRSFLRTELTLGQVLAVNTLAGQIIGPVMAIIGQWRSLNEFGLSMARVDDVITATPEPMTDHSTGEFLELTGEIEFKRVSFQYGNETSPLVLNNVSFKINPGETVAVVGKSGCGKTTLAYLLNLLYQPTGGEVLFNGISSTKIPLGQIRKQVGIILQEAKLFSDTIFANIALGDEAPVLRDVIAAARSADAHEFISGLKEGYLTKIGEDGVSLSGGQTQRVNIARVVYQNPKILVMDEATSALDALSEKVIVEHSRSRRQKYTTIIIAHRINTILSADRIFVMDKGEIVEMGTHRELLFRRGIYYELFRTQLGAAA